MFTGIIKEIGSLKKVIKKGPLVTLGVHSKLICEDAHISDSIAVNGVCLTLIYKDNGLMFFEAVGPTLSRTTLKILKRGDLVNLESALKANDKLGGHFVLGHIDSETKLRRIIKRSDCCNLEFDLPQPLKKFIIANGSVAIDGVSLTVKKVIARVFTVSVIPFTYKHTTLKNKRVGSRLNLECDYLLKREAK
ncbi:MAG: riboflavin synthase [Candidatus Omnitrophica bacterium]|nr:riboflavin synthase [Candidatus Omnitrophota bacterium]